MDIRSFFISLNQVTTPSGLAWVLISCLALTLISFTVLQIVDRNKKDKKNYKAYYFAVVFILAVANLFYFSAYDLLSVRKILALNTLQVIFLFLLPVIYKSVVFCLRKIKKVKRREKKNKTTTIDLYSFIPHGINSAGGQAETQKEKDDGLESSGVKDFFQEKKEVATKKENDYSHVKNIIERLSFYDLNSQEKKIVGELNLSVARVENGEDSISLKEKISDGLGGLLKIMAKYNL